MTIISFWTEIIFQNNLQAMLKKQDATLYNCLTLLPLGGALCARLLFNAFFLQVSVKDHGLKLSDF